MRNNAYSHACAYHKSKGKLGKQENELCHDLTGYYANIYCREMNNIMLQ